METIFTIFVQSPTITNNKLFQDNKKAEREESVYHIYLSIIRYNAELFVDFFIWKL